MIIIKKYLLFFLVSTSLLTLTLSGCAGSAGPTITNEVFPDNLPTLKPPFHKNQRFLVGQGFHGGISHQGILNAYAVDFAMPEGEPVCATKSGVVESYKDVDRVMQKNKKFREGNFVRLLHKDGTWGLYSHLAPGSVKVKPRQIVKQGECFARVGNTGYSTAPHLHFALLKLETEKKRFVSIPFRFIQPTGKAIVPQYLQWIKN